MNTPIMKSGLVITWVAIDAIIPYENNPRKIPKEAIEKVAASIREFGFRQPIVVDKDMVVMDFPKRFRRNTATSRTPLPMSTMPIMLNSTVPMPPVRGRVKPLV